MKTVKVNTLKNMARIMAEKAIEIDGAYYCLIEGEKVKVIK